MNKSSRSLMIYKVFSTIFCLSFLQAGGFAQEQPTCFGVFSSGQTTNTTNLDRLCGRKMMQNSNQSPSSQTEDLQVRSQVIYQEGFAKAQNRNYQAAIASFNQAISLNPDFPEAYIARAYAQMALKQDRESLQDFEKAAEIYRNRSDMQRANLLQYNIQLLRKHVKN